MDVTQTNFDAFYKEIQEYIPKADFYSIDFEMTGIKCNEYEMLADMPFEKYLKLRSAANKYRIIQVGLCLFFRTSEKEFHARPYNIYIFPREYFRVSPQINIDVSAADFNTKHNMDWNKWFYEGVTYMTFKQAKKRRTELDKEDQKQKFDPNNVAKIEREEDIQKSEKFVQDLKAWIAANSKEPFVIEEKSSFFRKHVYDVLGRDFPQLIYETIVKDESENLKQIFIYNFTDENDKKVYEERKIKEKDDSMFTHVGFTNVVQLLIDSKKPVVGHNCYFDLLFLYSHFIDSLPYNYEDFKKNLNKFFPEIYDTKFIVQNTKFRSKINLSSTLSVLADLFLKSEDPDLHDFKVVLDQEFKAYEPGNLENPRYHEAGYDAFLTGLIFAKMYYALEKEEQLKVKNAVNTMKCMFYLKLGEEDPMLKKATIYVIRAKENEGTTSSDDILKIFEAHKVEEPIKIHPLNSVGFPGAMLIFESENAKQKELFVHGIEELIQKGEIIMSYEEYCTLRKDGYNKGISKSNY